MSNKAELIFMKWKAELADMDRSKPAVEGNFELLFDQFFRSKIKMADALPYLDKAIKAHYPSDFVVKFTHKRMKAFSSESIHDFELNWKELISNTAKRVFFCFYEIDGAETTVDTKKYGGMSASEYRKQQRYADSHPSIDWEAIIKDRKESEALLKEEESKELQIDTSQVNIDINLGDL